MKKDPQQKFVLRFESNELKNKLETQAKRNHRSINSELLFRLEESFQAERKIKKLQKQANAIKDIEDGVKTLLRRKK